MNLKSLAKVAASKASRQLLVVQKHSPTIMFAVGIVGLGATVYLACRATLKLEPVIEEANNALESIKDSDDFTDNERLQAKVAVITGAVIRSARLYAPAAVSGVLTVASFSGSHILLNRRLAGAGAAYAALHRSFKEYRERVTNELGPEKDQQFRFGLDPVEEIATGEEPSKELEKRLRGKPSGYAVWFDDENRNWVNRQDHNDMFLRQIQNYANDKLQGRGHIFLNEVYDMLGMERTSAGAVVGWVIGNGDNYVDFGLDLNLDDRNRRIRAAMNGNDNIRLLDFNVDGLIWELISSIEQR